MHTLMCVTNKLSHNNTLTLTPMYTLSPSLSHTHLHTYLEDRDVHSLTLTHLEDGGIHLLVVVLLASMFPGDPEQALLTALPHQPRVQATVDLLHQPLA